MVEQKMSGLKSRNLNEPKTKIVIFLTPGQFDSTLNQSGINNIHGLLAHRQDTSSQQHNINGQLTHKQAGSRRRHDLSK